MQTWPAPSGRRRSRPICPCFGDQPPLTAAFLGAAYLSAFVIEFLSARETLWARARIAVPAVLLFTILTLVATILHIDKFHFGGEFRLITQAGTWVWMLVYAIVPVAMSVLLVQQLCLEFREREGPGIVLPNHRRPVRQPVLLPRHMELM